MSVEEYWIGKGIDLEKLWADFEAGEAYIDKFKTVQPYLLRLTFSEHPTTLPLFDHEVICKTIKGLFHDIKAEWLTIEAYNAASPIFVYRIERGSGIFEFLAERHPLIALIALLSTTILGAAGTATIGYQQFMSMDQERIEKGWHFIRSEFPAADEKDYSAYVNAWSPWEKRKIVQKLIKNGLYKIEISKQPFVGNEARPEVLDVTRLSK